MGNPNLKLNGSRFMKDVEIRSGYGPNHVALIADSPEAVASRSWVLVVEEGAVREKEK